MFIFSEHRAGVAQLVEHSFRKAEVTGSTPVASSNETQDLVDQRVHEVLFYSSARQSPDFPEILFPTIGNLPSIGLALGITMAKPPLNARGQ